MRSGNVVKGKNTVDTYDLLFLCSLFSDSIYLTMFLFNEQMAHVNTINIFILIRSITCYILYYEIGLILSPS